MAGGKPVAYMCIYMRSQEIEPGTTSYKFNEWSE